MIVVDANIAMAWCINIPQLSPVAIAVRKQNAIVVAPDFIIAEVTNGLVLASRSTPDAVDYVLSSLEQLPRWFTELVPAVSLRTEAFSLASELGHPAYDCFYLALALRRQIKFVTADQRFARRLKGTRYAESLEPIA
jgi:predicted nucleic acid-binding protein